MQAAFIESDRVFQPQIEGVADERMARELVEERKQQEKGRTSGATNPFNNLTNRF